jgi:hypothetical protein
VIGQKEPQTPGKQWRSGLSGRKLSGDPKQAVHESFSPAYAGAMSTKHINTAADLVRFGASVRIDCGKCGATRTLGGTEMVKACGAGDLEGERAPAEVLQVLREGGLADGAAPTLNTSAADVHPSR